MTGRPYELYKRIMKRDEKAIEEISSLEEAKEIITMMAGLVYINGKPVNFIGKWVAYQKQGIEPILHGQIVEYYETSYRVKRKNAYHDLVDSDQVIGIFNAKEECYRVR